MGPPSGGYRQDFGGVVRGDLMSLFRNIRSGLRSLFRKGQVDRELDEELGAYVEMAADEKMRQGMSRKQALRAVRLESGSLDATKEIVRSGGWESFVEACWQDLRNASRTLRKSPSFTAVALLTLTLGIGANTAIFSVVNAVVLRPLPYKDSNHLVQVIGHDQQRGVDFDWVSFPNYHDWAEQNKAFQYMAAYKFHALNLTNVSQAQMLFGIKASANLLPTLGAEPILGRNFRPEEDEPGRDHEVILGYDTWTQWFGADPQIIGKAITLSGELYTVIGVMPAKFNFPPTVPVTSFLPSRKTQFLAPLGITFNPTQRDWNMLGVIARLRPGVTIGEAGADLSIVARNLELQYPAQDRGLAVRVEPLLNQVVGDVRPALWILLAAVSLVLLVACANVTSLLLARSTIREKEIALRASLGASRPRLVQQLLTESLLRPSRVDVSEPLKSQSRTSAPGAKQSHLRGALVVSEVALSLALLIGAGLMLKSFVRLEGVDPGFQADKLLTVWTILSEAKYPPQQRVGFYQRVWERIRSVPGVKSVGAIDDLPLTGIRGGGPFTIEGHPTKSDNDAPTAYRCTVSADYFKTMGIPLLQGREFTDRDREGAP